MNRLYSLCWLYDGVHWLLISANGEILGCSPAGFATEEDALIDLQHR
jgi:hypothetical protein